MRLRAIVTVGAGIIAAGFAVACAEPASTRGSESEDPSTSTVTYPETGFVEAEGARLYTTTLGTGEPIVVLHGGPGFDHRQFLPYIWELASRHKVILYDQRATGLSTGDVDSASITMDRFIADIEAIREAFGIERMNLMGHSWGGMLALHYAILHPERLRSLMLLSTSATHESFADMRAAIEARRPAAETESLERIAASDAFRSRDPRAVERFWRVYFRVYFPDPEDVDRLDLVFTPNTLANANAVAGLILRSAGPFDLHADLESLDIPTLVLHGDSDPMPVSYAERIVEHVPGAELVVLERSGHWGFVDAMPQIRENVEAFLDRVAAGIR